MLTQFIPPHLLNPKVVFLIGLAIASTSPLVYRLLNSSSGVEGIVIPVSVPQEVGIDPAWDNNLEYCSDKPIVACHQQFLLRFQQYINNASNREISRLVAESNVRPTIKGEDCYGQSSQVCLATFGRNITTQMQSANTNREWLSVLGAAVSLSNAQAGAIPATPTAPDRFQILAAWENWQNQIAFYQANAEGQSRNQVMRGDRRAYTEPAQGGRP